MWLRCVLRRTWASTWRSTCLAYFESPRKDFQVMEKEASGVLLRVGHARRAAWPGDLSRRPRPAHPIRRRSSSGRRARRRALPYPACPTEPALSVSGLPGARSASRWHPRPFYLKLLASPRSGVGCKPSGIPEQAACTDPASACCSFPFTRDLCFCSASTASNPASSRVNFSSSAISRITSSGTPCVS